MTNAQTEARAIAALIPIRMTDAGREILAGIIASVLTAKDAELAAVKAERDEHLRLKNELVLSAYPAMDAVDAVKIVLADHAHPDEIDGLSLSDAVRHEIERAWAASRYNADQYIASSIALRTAEAQLAEANKALEPFAALADIFDHKGGNRPTTGVIAQWSDHRVGDRELTVEDLRAARRALEAQGVE